MLGNLLALGCGIAAAVMHLTMAKLASHKESISVIIVGHAITAAFTLPFLAIYPPAWGLKPVGILLLPGVVPQGDLLQPCDPLLRFGDLLGDRGGGAASQSRLGVFDGRGAAGAGRACGRGGGAGVDHRLVGVRCVCGEKAG